jgi:2-hydroxy-3-oxopropionate reductase
MASIGFIGLGIMGRPMAANLVRAGHTVRGFTRGAAGREAAVALGVPVVDSIAEAVSDADTVITMLPDTPDVELVARGPGGILASASAGTSYIDMSTIDPGATRALNAQLAAAGVGMLDAPVSGGERGAIEATLSIMVGGAESQFAASRDILGALGTTVVRVGDSGAGQVVKAANQLLVAGHLQMLAEALCFLHAHEVDERLALSVIGQGLAGSAVIARKQEDFLTQIYKPGFRVELHHKDLGIVQGAARRRGVALPATALIAQLMQALVTQGNGHLDHSALYLLANQMNSPASEMN